MKCPLCNTEARITSSKNVVKDNKLFRRVVYTCQNKKCDYLNKEIKTEDIELKVEFE